MRLQCHVAEVLENEHAQIVGVAGDGRNRERYLCEQPADVHERKLVEFEWLVVDRQHDRRIVRPHDPEVLPRGRVAGERHDANLRPRELRPLKYFVDPDAGVPQSR